MGRTRSSDTDRNWSRRAQIICVAMAISLAGTDPCVQADDPPVSRNLERAQTFIEKQEYEQALPFLNASIQGIRSAEALYLRGHVLLKLGQTTAAEKDAETLMKQYDSDWRGYFLKVRSLLRTGSLRKHRKELSNLLQDTLKYKPDHRRARVLLGRVYASMGRTKRALKHFRNVPDETRQTPRAGRTAARMAFLEGKSQLAKSLAESVLAVAPGDPLAARIHSFVQNGVRRAVERRIRHFEQRSAGTSPEKRLKKLNSLQDQFSDVAHLLLFCARRLHELGIGDRVRELIRRAEHLGGDEWTAFELGNVYRRRKKYSDAADWYLKACTRRESFAPARLRAGVAFSRDGKHKRAVRELRRVFDHVSVNEEASEQLVRSCLELDYLVFARERLNALALSSDKKTSFRNRIDKQLKKRREREEESIQNQVYRNPFYGFELSLPKHWSYSPDAGRPELVALFISTSSQDRFLIAAERRLPSFRDRTLDRENTRSDLRAYLISKFMLKKTKFQFMRERFPTDFDGQAVEYVFRRLDKKQRMHCFVVFRDRWMLTFHYLARGEEQASRERMNTMIKQVIIHNE